METRISQSAPLFCEFVFRINYWPSVFSGVTPTNKLNAAHLSFLLTTQCCNSVVVFVHS
jgi:hypothetical protein